MCCKKPACHKDRDPKRIFKAQRTTFTDITSKIHLAPLHAQIVLKIIRSGPSVQRRNTAFAGEFVDASLFCYSYLVASFDQSRAVILQIVSFKYSYERLGDPTEAARGMCDTHNLHP